MINQHYLKRYKKFINACRDQEIPAGTYTEKHHVIPRWLGGPDDSWNIVVLTFRQHFIAHHLLAKADRHRNNCAALACMRMSNSKTKRRPTSRQFEICKIAQREANTGENHPGLGKKRTAEQCEANRQIQIERFKDQENRDSVSRGVSKYFEDPEARKRQSELQKERHKNNPEEGIAHSKRMKDHWGKEEVRNAQAERTRNYMKENGCFNRDFRIHRFKNVETGEVIGGMYKYLKDYSKQLFGMSNGGVTTLKLGGKVRVKNWIYLGYEETEMSILRSQGRMPK